MTQTAPADDRGLLLGDGLFETVLVKAGRPVLWRQHIERLARASVAIGLPAPDPAALEQAAAEALARTAAPRAALRLTWTAGSGGRGLDRPEAPAPRLIATCAPAPALEGPIALAVAEIRRNERSPVSRLKTLAYLDNVLARRAARAVGADEALMLNTAGEVAGCAAANVFWLKGDDLFTPALACGALDGVMRAQVMARGEAAGLRCREVHALLDDIEAAETIFVTNSLIGLRPAASLDGRSLAQERRVEALRSALGEVS